MKNAFLAKQALLQITDISQLDNFLMKLRSLSMEFKDTKLSVNEVAKQLGISWETANNRINDNLKGYPKQKSSKVDKHHEIIKNILEDENKSVSSKIGLFKYLENTAKLDDIDYSFSTFKYYINTRFSDEFNKSNKRRYSTRFETEPGHQAQFDFKEKFTIINNDGSKIKIDVAVYQLAFSRIVYRKLIPNKSTKVVIDFLVEAFEATGGVPTELVVDNAKCLVLKHTKDLIELNHTFEQFAKDFGFEVYACRPRSAQTKGKVENTMKALNALSIHNGEYNGLDSIQEQIDILTNGFNNETHRTTNLKPNMLHIKEKVHLKSLPRNSVLNAYKLIWAFECIVPNTNHINYRGTGYSVPWKYVNKKVSAYINDSNIHIYYNKILIASHVLSSKLFATDSQHIHPSLNKRLNSIPNKSAIIDPDDFQLQSAKNINKLVGGKNAN